MICLYEYAFEPEKWQAFYEDYASNEHAYKADINSLKLYIENEKYLEVLKNYEDSGQFPIPRLIMLNKKGTGKKRAVFSFEENASWLLKFFGYYLHIYDNIFSDNLYSFRKERSAKNAVTKLLKQKNLTAMYGVKLDIHDYFNSADTDIILEKLKDTLDKNDRLYDLFENILKNPYVYYELGKTDKEDLELEEIYEVDHGKIDSDEVDSEKLISSVHKGMMAGSPLSPFLANLYLNDLDEHLGTTLVFYARYSDDMILFSENAETIKRETEYIVRYLKENGLELNPDKIMFINPGDTFEFLGFSFEQGNVDVAEASYEKIKKKLRRKSRAILRWRLKKNIDAEKAARVYIRYFNRKFFENPIKSELTWCRWYFPIITTDEKLKK